MNDRLLNAFVVLLVVVVLAIIGGYHYVTKWMNEANSKILILQVRVELLEKTLDNLEPQKERYY